MLVTSDRVVRFLILIARSHFYSEIQHPASKKSMKIILKCQIVDIDVLLGRSIQHFCNEVLFDGPERHFHSTIQHPASKNG